MQDTRELRRFSRGYTTKNDKLAWFEVSWTLVGYGISLYLAIALAHLWWAVIPLVILTGAFSVRTYMLQHDCMHRALFLKTKINDLVGTLVSPISLTPYQATRYNHNLHHAHVGDLDHREAFEIDIMTIREYNAAPPWRRVWYRFYRSPFTLLVVGPFVLYLVLRRFPRNAFKTGILDVILHDLAVVGMFVGLYAWAGWSGVFVLLGSIYVGATCGAIIPYTVHNFEQVYWGRKPEYTYDKGAMEGTSVLDFGAFFDFVTANIAYHDLHHLNANIPSYNLKRCYEEAGDLIQSRKIGLREAISCYGWKLYDEDSQQMVGFGAARRLRAPFVREPAE